MRELRQLNIPNKEKSVCLSQNLEEFQNLLQFTKSTFDVITITETTECLKMFM